MDLLYLTILAGFLGVYAFMAILIGNLEMIKKHTEALRIEAQYISLMIEDRIKRELNKENKWPTTTD